MFVVRRSVECRAFCATGLASADGSRSTEFCVRIGINAGLFVEFIYLEKKRVAPAFQSIDRRIVSSGIFWNA
jgi:hypothetical protein